MAAHKEIQNGRIDSTMLGREDHGILTAVLHIKGDGWGVGFGGFAFDEWDEAKDCRVCIAFGCEFIRRVLDVVDVGRWEELPGKYLRIELVGGWGGGVGRIGHITKDVWFDPRTLADELRKEEEMRDG